MRIPRIYQNCSLEAKQSLQLDERACKHLIQVLRLDREREIILFNGEGGEYKARIIQASKKEVVVDILEYIDVNREPSIQIHLAQCVSKGDRFEFALQKAVELGVTQITPVFSKRSQLKMNHERKDKKFIHWQKIMLSACEQSGRTSLVSLNDAVEFTDFIETADNGSNIILHPEAKTPLSSISASGNYTLLIGPEGGFEDVEIDMAETKTFLPLRLGKQILRTETAPIAAIAALNFLEKEF